MPTLRLTFPALATIALTAACGSGSSAADRGAADATTTPLTQTCPSPAGGRATFPKGPASDVPHPGYAQSPRRLRTDVAGQDEVQFTTATPLSVAAAFVQKAYQAAGYRIVGGDAEAHEADILWAHGNSRGKTRLSGAGCMTTWTVLALARGQA